MGFTGAKVLEFASQVKDPRIFRNMIYDQNLLRIATRFYNHPTGDTDIELEQPAADLMTDTYFGSVDQKSVELMSGHTRTSITTISPSRQTTLSSRQCLIFQWSTRLFM